MPESVKLDNVVEDILSSYEARIENIGAVFDTTSLILGNLQELFLNSKQEREKINAQLRDVLAKNEHLRKKDFDNMMQGILQVQEQREREIGDLLKEYFNEQKTIAQSLRKSLLEFKEILARGETGGVKEFQAKIKEIFAKAERKRKEDVSKLKEFQGEQHEIAERLKELLAKGEALRIKDFKLMLNELKRQRAERLQLQKKRKEEVAKMLTGFRKERQKLTPKA